MNLVANLMSGALIGNCIYKFTDHSNFNHARSVCKSYGGDLINRNLGPNGAVYHELVKNCFFFVLNLSFKKFLKKF